MRERYGLDDDEKPRTSRHHPGPEGSGAAESDIRAGSDTRGIGLLRASAQLAFRSVLRHRRRTAFAVAAITLGVAASILAGSFMQWIFWAARQGAIESGLGHIEITKRGYHEAEASDTNKFLLAADATELREMRALPGVRTVAVRRAFSGLASHGDATLSFLGEAVDPASERNFGDVSVVIRGEELSPGDPRGALLGEGLAANLGVVIGDPLVLVASPVKGGINAVEVVVRGLMGTISKAYDDSAIRVSSQAADDLLREPGAHSWVMVLRRTEDTDGMIQALRARYGDRFDLAPWYERADFYNKTVALLTRQMMVVKVVIALVVMLMISNSMLMAVMERTAEIGTCMALGASSRTVLAQFSLEAALLGIIGAALGAALGVAFAELISFVGIPMPPPPGQSRGYIGRMLVTPTLVGEAALLAASTALLAGIVPALKASRTEIVSSLRSGR